jgi:hypothetical protein
MKDTIFYCTSCSAGIKHGCVIYPDLSWTPLYCNNSVQHKQAAIANMHHIVQRFVYINVNGIKPSIVFGHDTLNNWFEFETTVATYSSVQGSDTTKLSKEQKPVTKK